MLAAERKIQIEMLTRELQHEMWRDRAQLRPDYHPNHVCPLKVFEPEVAALFLGLEYEALPTLGRFGDHHNRFELAGLLDRHQKKMLVSRAPMFSIEAQRFTGAHEIGHYQLHQNQVAFRERPISKYSHNTPQDPMEQEANFFAACFLMPRYLVMKRFAQIFGSKVPVTVDATLAWYLAGDDHEDLLYSTEPLLKEKAIARCNCLGTDHFASLAEQFGVSVESMAIRLKELELVSP